MKKNKERKLRLLIIDDEEDIGQSMQSIFEKAGYEAEWANSGPEAIRIATACAFDLIFLDICLPQISGLEVFRSLKKINNNFKVCIMTGWPKGVEEHREEYVALLSEGATDMILRKPFGKDEVLRIAEEILEA